MKLFLSSIMVVFFAPMAFASQQILNWKTSEMSQTQALIDVEQGVQSVLEDDNDCELVRTWAFEAINNLKDFYGNPVIVVVSTVEVRGCPLEKYQDCRTVFSKQNGLWKNEITTCEAEEAAE